MPLREEKTRTQGELCEDGAEAGEKRLQAEERQRALAAQDTEGAGRTLPEPPEGAQPY